MTYKEIINRFRTATENHYMLQDFGYGQLSDLKTQSQLGPEEQGVDYPYLFLLPQAHNRQGPVMNYTFNMIVMDMARTEEGDVYDNYISIQSQCQQYIDDMLAYLYFAYKDQPEIQLTNIQYNAFKEKYQDELAGMTATITIQVPQPIDNCNSPIEPIFEEIVNVTRVDDLTLGPDPGDNTAFTYNVNIVNNGQWQINKYVVDETNTYKFVMTQDIVFNELQPGEVYPRQPILREITTFIVRPATKSNWPTNPVAGEVYSVTMEWKADIVDTGGTVWEFLVLTDDVGQPEGTLVQKANGNLKVYKAT